MKPIELRTPAAYASLYYVSAFCNYSVVFMESSSNRAETDCRPTINLEDFPSTRYQGSKRKILPWIHTILQPIDFHTALDLFGGTGSVSYLLKKLGKSVTYNDALHFNYLIGQALIENESVLLSREDIHNLLSPSVVREYSFVAETFKGIYFSNAENQWIDAMCMKISKLGASLEGEFKAALAYYALFQACLAKRPFNLFHRKNLYLRHACVERTFGNKATWDRPFSNHFKQFAQEANRLVFKGQAKCRAMNHDASEFPNADFDLVYLDPPYLRKQGSHETADYRRCYHFLEGIANYDEWHSLVDLETANRRLKIQETNIWCDRKKCSQAFDELFGRFPKSTIVISYRKGGVPSLSTIVRLLRRHRRLVHVHTRHYKYALNHQNGDAKFNREALIVGMKA